MTQDKRADIYTKTVVGRDEHFFEDLPGYVVYVPPGSKIEDLPNGVEILATDYAPGLPDGRIITILFTDGLLDEALLELLPELSDEWKLLGLRAPFVALVDLEADSLDRQHDLARAIETIGDEPPLIALSPAPTLDFSGHELSEMLGDSLRHEMGHHFMRSQLVLYEEDEEDVVERYALTRDRDVLFEYAKDAPTEEDEEW